jgi:hypothetical protein
VPVKSSLVAVSVAIVVAGLVTALKDRAAIQEALGFSAPQASPQLMLMGRITGPDGLPKTPAIDVQSISEQIQSTVAAPASEPPVSKPAQQASDGLAQAPPLATTQRLAPVATQQAQPKVDESALRYFASRGDKARLQAEISRLQALYPNWTPPADPLAVPQGGDKQLEAMWQLYSEGRYAELRKPSPTGKRRIRLAAASRSSRPSRRRRGPRAAGERLRSQAVRDSRADRRWRRQAC